MDELLYMPSKKTSRLDKLAIPLLLSTGNNAEAMWCLYTILVMAVYWIAECLPLAITSMLPLVLLPLLGVASTAEVSPVDSYV